MKRTYGSSLLSLAVLVAGCPTPPRPMEDAAPQRDATPTPTDVAEDVAPQPQPDASSDGGTRRPREVIDPTCAPLRPTIGAGVGNDVDRCEGVTPPANGSGATFCSLGADVPGLRVPEGFCIRRYATVGLPRVMLFAPNGDLFISSPSAITAAGDGGGMGAILVLSDDNRDGTAEVHTFATGGLDTVHGLTFKDGFLYFNTTDTVFRTPYARGQRVETMGARQVVVGGAGTAIGTQFQRGGRWTHGLATSVNGRMLATRGEYGSCSVAPDGRPASAAGEIYEVGMGVLTQVGGGFRNPMYARCHYCRDLCMVAELGEDQTMGAVETLVVVDNNHWNGYPCCFQNNTGPRASTGLCRCINQQQVKINLGDTPFGFDWERGSWPAPYRNGVFVALHGSFYTQTMTEPRVANYEGAGVVYLPTDPATGIPQAGTPVRFIEGTEATAQVSLRRPSDVMFSPDGRLFVTDDKGGGVYWVAPMDRRM
jgi:glucose/arabinose dehydrogenase